MTGRTAAIIVGAVLWAGVPAAAQPAASGSRIEVASGGVLVAPRSLGTIGADLTQPDGTPYELFRVSRRERPGIGVELIVGLRLVSRLWAEASGAWIRSELQTRATDDREGAADLTIAGPLSHAVVEGGLSWHALERPAGAFFVRGSVGWVRELAGRSGLFDDGISATVGAGVKYWGNRAPAAPGRVGLRAEFRAVMRTAHLASGASDRVIAPAGYAGLLVRF